MKDRTRKFVLNFVVLALFYCICTVFFEGRVNLIWYFFRGCFVRKYIGPDDFRFIFRVEPIGCILFVLLLFLLLRVIFSFLGMLTGGGAEQVRNTDNKKWFSEAGSSPSGKGWTADKTVRTDSRSAGTAGKTVRTDSRSTGTAGKTGRAYSRSTWTKLSNARTGSENLTRTYKTGKERYMEQLDDLLRDGLITREEYKELAGSYDRATWNGKR